jgi:hypothetical protein
MPRGLPVTSLLIAGRLPLRIQYYALFWIVECWLVELKSNDLFRFFLIRLPLIRLFWLLAAHNDVGISLSSDVSFNQASSSIVFLMLISLSGRWRLSCWRPIAR